ncbi:MAG TPA: hypothetical protein VNE61_09845 [Ktedonobacteraceae bacterium]|nr:hypothetical protein [Ktedonobacteraceae bacterium]
MIRRTFGCLLRLVVLAIALVVIFVLLAPSLIRGAGNTLISALNNSTAQGVAQLIPGLQGKTDALQLQISGLLPSTAYYVTLDQGQCPGPELLNIGKVSTDSSGGITTLFTLNQLQSALQGAFQGDLQQGLYVDVHSGDPSGQSVACGKVLSQLSLLVTPTPTPTTAPVTVTPTTGATPTASPTSAPTPTPATTTGNTLREHGYGGFPNTGVAPGASNSYDNYTYPRKY